MPEQEPLRPSHPPDGPRRSSSAASGPPGLPFRGLTIPCLLILLLAGSFAPGPRVPTACR